MLIQGSLYELEPFTLSVNVDAASIVTTITYPAGVSYFSHETTGVEDASFVDPTWTIAPYVKDTIKTLTITVEITDIALFSALAPEDRIVEGDSAVLVGEVVILNNHAEKLIEDTTCLDLLNCASEELEEFDSMSDAVAALGTGRMFLASLVNIEGWSYRAVLVTPLIT